MFAVEAIGSILTIARQAGATEPELETLVRCRENGTDPSAELLRYLASLWGQEMRPGAPAPGPGLDRFIALAEPALAVIDVPAAQKAQLNRWLLIAHGAAGNKRQLVESRGALVEMLYTPPFEPVLVTLIAQLRDCRLDGELLALLLDMGDRWYRSQALARETIATVVAVTSRSVSLDDLVALSNWMTDAVALTSLRDCPRPIIKLVNDRLPAVAAKCHDLWAARELCLRHATDPPAPEAMPAVAMALHLLIRHDAADGLERLIQVLGDARPADPALAWARSRLIAATGRPLDEAISLMRALDLHAGGLAPIHWLVGVLEREGRLLEADEFSRKLATLAPLRPTPDRHADGGLTLESLGVLAAALDAMPGWVNAPHKHGDPLDPSAIRDQVAASLARLRGFLVSWTAFDALACKQAVIRLRVLVDRRFKMLSAFAESSPFERTEKYGTLDPARFRAAYLGMLEHIAELAGFALRSPNPMQGAASVQTLIDLAQYLAAALIDARQPERAKQEMRQIIGRMQDIGSAMLWQLMERCCLAHGDLAGASEARVRGGIRRGTTHPLQEFEAWVRSEGLDSKPVLCDPAEQTIFEKVQRDGSLERIAHEVPALTLWAARVSGLRMRESFLAIGPSGTILRPGRYAEVGDYPYPASAVLASGGGVAATLADCTDWTRIRQPVLVFDHMQVLHPNYYHWMLEILSRAAYADEHGLLSDRQLLVPEEAAGWMHRSLGAAGIEPSRILCYAAADALMLDDALVLSSADFSSRSLVHALRDRLWRAAGVSQLSPSSGQGRLLFVARRGHADRRLLNQNAVYRIAEQMGFEVVSPETLSLLEQVQMFSQARAVAGLEGAAFTNLMFSPPGTPVLAITSEEDTEPTYINLSAICGHRHRYLLGHRSDEKSPATPNILSAPYVLDEKLLAQQLGGLMRS